MPLDQEKKAKIRQIDRDLAHNKITRDDADDMLWNIMGVPTLKPQLTDERELTEDKDKKKCDKKLVWVKLGEGDDQWEFCTFIRSPEYVAIMTILSADDVFKPKEIDGHIYWVTEGGLGRKAAKKTIQKKIVDKDSGIYVHNQPMTRHFPIPLSMMNANIVRCAS